MPMIHGQKHLELTQGILVHLASHPSLIIFMMLAAIITQSVSLPLEIL